MADEKILERVRRLLAQAEDQAGTPEGDTFSAKAEELMIRHGIEQAVLDEADGTSKGEVTSRRIFCHAPYAKQKAGLVCTVAAYNQGKAVVHEPLGGWSKGCAVYAYGFAADLDTIEFLFTSLSLQAVTALATRAIPRDRFGDRMDAATFRAGWLMDFDRGVASRMAEMEQRAKAAADRKHAAAGGQPGGAELVLRDKKQQVTDHVRELYPHMGVMRSRSSGRGRGDGFAAGRSADLGQQRFSGSRKQLAN